MRERSVVVLLGRMGNQLFQFSFARWLQTQGHDVRFDLAGVRRERVASPLRDAVGPLGLPTSRLWPAPLGRFETAALTLRRAIGPRRVVVDLTTDGRGSTTAPITPAWWVGYWQQSRFADVARKELLQLLDVGGQASPSIAVHVRRGDYVGLGASQPASWYRRALSQAREQFPGLPVIVVSDDPRWCQQHLAWPDTHYSDGRDPLADFRRLAASEAIIASPSSFSWWACYLGTGTPFYPCDDHRATLWGAIHGQEIE